MCWNPRGRQEKWCEEESPAQQLGAIGLSKFEREEEKKEIVLNSDVTNSKEMKYQY